MDQSSQPKLKLFVSALSGRGRALRRAPQVAALLRSQGWNVDVRVTHRSDDPAALAAACTNHWVAVLGGDGYIARIATQVGARGGVVIALPGGRGNDLCRCLGIGTDAVAHVRSLPMASEICAEDAGEHPRIRGVDAMQVRALNRANDGQVAGGQRPPSPSKDLEGEDLEEKPAQVLGIVSFGLDAVANQIANDTSIASGTFAYAWGALRALQQFHPKTMEIEVDGTRRRIRGWLVSVSNSGWFGGGINIVPSSNPSDGRLELLTVDPVPKRHAIRVLARVLAMRKVDDPILHVEQVTSVKIWDSAGLVAMGDGDQVGEGPLEISVSPEVFRVFV
ncbi:diacylglycerol kinase family protein [uncultured Actinomyces sp.]|uniref:diacylglycerol/lipid kinase family protein n=1 Tax=uncultured Actinomyces sp. TaxID=249061 RepID=UPI0028E9B514|nr:diacylglycerol kinase family protein [uncultured Actinomyces sp.]